MISKLQLHESGSLEQTSYNHTNLPIEICQELRSAGYIDCIKSLDADSKESIQLLPTCIQMIVKEFSGHDSNTLPRYIIARCQLGLPYDVHVIDIQNGYILTHLNRDDIRVTLQNGRMLAKNYNYALVEVYEDRILLVL